MPLAPGLLVRTLVHPGGRRTTVVVRCSRRPPQRRRPAGTTLGQPDKPGPVPRQSGHAVAGDAVPGDAVPGDAVAGFTLPVVRALAVLADRARPVGAADIALDGRRVPLIRLVAEANRRLVASGRAPISYPGVCPAGTGR